MKNSTSRKIIKNSWRQRICIIINLLYYSHKTPYRGRRHLTMSHRSYTEGGCLMHKLVFCLCHKYQKILMKNYFWWCVDIDCSRSESHLLSTQTIIFCVIQGHGRNIETLWRTRPQMPELNSRVCDTNYVIHFISPLINRRGWCVMASPDVGVV